MLLGIIVLALWLAHLEAPDVLVEFDLRVHVLAAHDDFDDAAQRVLGVRCC